MLDLIFILIFGYFIISSYKRGFIQFIFYLLKDVLSFIITKFLYKNLLTIFGIYSFIESLFDNMVRPMILNLSLDSLYNTLSSFSIFSEDLRNILISFNNSSQSEFLFTMKESIADNIIICLTNFVGYILVFIMVSMAFSAFIKFLDLFTKLPIIKTLNNFLGAVVGILVAHMICVVVISSLFMLNSFMSEYKVNKDLLDSSKIVGFYRDHNLVLNEEIVQKQVDKILGNK